jgi:hypothetical protein
LSNYVIQQVENIEVVVQQGENFDIVIADDVLVVETAPIALTINNTGSLTFDHVQSTPATVWNINHNKGIYLNPEAYSVSGMRVNAEILQISVNQVQIIFNQPIAGFAHLS